MWSNPVWCMGVCDMNTIVRVVQKLSLLWHDLSTLELQSCDRLPHYDSVQSWQQTPILHQSKMHRCLSWPVQLPKINLGYNLDLNLNCLNVSGKWKPHLKNSTRSWCLQLMVNDTEQPVLTPQINPLPQFQWVERVNFPNSSSHLQ